ncbi:N-alpha-acetyltransferase 30-like [Rhopilema esculentum]|uniref:N-alpha-acetyltransferase 30-like n=1 Tax=Rhopilema esculentum TaxID=499914 RepID=UPI0031E1DEB6|eukprot:gene2706-918_t
MGDSSLEKPIESENSLEYVCKDSTNPKNDTLVLKNGVIDRQCQESSLKKANSNVNHAVNHSVNCSTNDNCVKIQDSDNTVESSDDQQGIVANGSQLCDDSSGNEEPLCSKELNFDKTVREVPIDTNKEGLNGCSESRDASEAFSLMVIKDQEIDKEIQFIQYESEKQLPDLVALITIDLSEPYSIYTYRYFLHNWPHLSHLAYENNVCVGAIVCKLEIHRKSVMRGYIAMLVVHRDYRRCKIGSSLVKKAVRKMKEHGCEEVVLETEVTNKAALQLYENLGFVRDKRLFRYYLNGVDAWRLKLWLK